MLQCERIDEHKIFWNWQSNFSSLFFVRAIANLFKQGSKTACVLGEGIKVVIGCSDKANDIKVVARPLKEAYPRVYALAANKRGAIRNFGLLLGSKWS